MSHLEIRKLIRLLRHNLQPDPKASQLAETIRDWSWRLEDTEDPARPVPDPQKPQQADHR